MKHKGLKKILSVLLAYAVILNAIGEGFIEDMLFSVAFAELEPATIIVYDNYTATYTIVGSWENHQNINVTITNTGTETIESWMLMYDNYCGEILNIWNAAVTYNDVDVKHIRNVGHNANILPGKSVSFGYTLTNVTYEIPYAMVLVQERVEKTDGFVASLNVMNSWNGAFNGQIVLANETDMPIEWWEFTFSSNFTITEVIASWDATFTNISDCEYMFKGTHTGIISPNSSVTLGFQATMNDTPAIYSELLTEVVLSPDFLEIPENCRLGGTISSPLSGFVNFVNGNTEGSSGRATLNIDVLELIQGTTVKASDIYGIEAITWGNNTENRQVFIDVRTDGGWVSSPRFHGSSNPHPDFIWATMSHGSTPDNGGRTEENILTYMNIYGSTTDILNNVVPVTPFTSEENPLRFEFRIRANNNHSSLVAAIILLDMNGEPLGSITYSTQNADGIWGNFFSLVRECICDSCEFIDDEEDDIVVIDYCNLGGIIEPPLSGFVNFENGNTEGNSGRTTLNIDVIELISGTPIKANEVYGVEVSTWGNNTENRQVFIDVRTDGSWISSPMFHASGTPNDNRIWVVMEHGDTPDNGGRTEGNILTYMNMYGGTPKVASDIVELAPFVDDENPENFEMRIRANNNHPSLVTTIVLLDINGEALGGIGYTTQDAYGVWTPFVSVVEDCICGMCDLDDVGNENDEFVAIQHSVAFSAMSTTVNCFTNHRSNVVYTGWTDATCTTNRVEHYRCRRLLCRTMNFNVIVPNTSLGHVRATRLVTATCVTPGRFRCNRVINMSSGFVFLGTRTCNVEFNTSRDSSNHSMSSWRTTVRATCTVRGTRIRSCNRNGCNHTETDRTAVLGHNFGSWQYVNTTSCNQRRTCSRSGCTRAENRTQHSSNFNGSNRVCTRGTCGMVRGTTSNFRYMFRGSNASIARRVTQRYPVYSFGGSHSGIDIVTTTGNSEIESMAVYPVSSGIVTRASIFSAYGLCVFISHENNLETRYAHFESGSVPSGILHTEITHSRRIGRVGFTGMTAAHTWHGGEPNSTDAHLHFEVRENGQLRNPVNYYPNGVFAMPNY
ncbi:MAG: cellulose binding domain-containing protein [Oscillospiraceae bacterium]|jgi:hypothetical protein|nr:cellulose binding domain-containing protein [Oscillospiraceae bacterium]